MKHAVEDAHVTEVTPPPHALTSRTIVTSSKGAAVSLQRYAISGLISLSLIILSAIGVFIAMAMILHPLAFPWFSWLALGCFGGIMFGWFARGEKALNLLGMLIAGLSAWHIGICEEH